MNRKFRFLAILMMLLAAFVFTGCDGNAADDLFDGDNGGDGPTPITYTVSFEMKGHGTQIDPITGVESGAKITKPADPTATGFNFVRWCKDVDCITAWNFASDTVTEDITLYAKWTQTVVSVTGVSLDVTELTITVGDQPVQLTATVAPDGATDKSVNWSSDDVSVATVDAYGKVTAVAPGDATITVTTVDGSKTANCTVTALPAGALAGVFSVSDDDGTTITKIHFSKGNLYYNGSAFKFEENQYSFANSWDASHVSHFYWSADASVTYAESYNDSDVFFSNATETTANAGFTVNGVTGKYRTLSKDEWVYLFNTRTASTVSGIENARYTNATVNNKAGIILLPDTYTHPGEVTALTSINTASAAFTANTYDLTNWAKMESAGAVFLPAAGYRDGSDVYYVGTYGYYWSATAYGSNYAYDLLFGGNYMDPNHYDSRYRGRSVRLVWCEN